MHKYLLIFMLCLSGLSWAEGPTPELLRLNPQGVAIDGYSPVSYFQRGKAEQGSAEFSASYKGATYWFTDARQVAMFNENPDQFLPAHGGWCSLMLSGSGQRTPANPESWVMVDGQLLLFWSGTFKDMEINGLKNWESKTKGSEKKALKRLATANKTWDAIIAGKKEGAIILFNEDDEGRVTPAQLLVAKKNF